MFGYPWDSVYVRWQCPLDYQAKAAELRTYLRHKYFPHEDRRRTIQWCQHLPHRCDVATIISWLYQETCLVAKISRGNCF
jgi:hypothetical protein